MLAVLRVWYRYQAIKQLQRFFRNCRQNGRQSLDSNLFRRCNKHVLGPFYSLDHCPFTLIMGRRKYRAGNDFAIAISIDQPSPFLFITEPFPVVEEEENLEFSVVPTVPLPVISVVVDIRFGNGHSEFLGAFE